MKHSIYITSAQTGTHVDVYGVHGSLAEAEAEAQRALRPGTARVGVWQGDEPVKEGDRVQDGLVRWL